MLGAEQVLTAKVSLEMVLRVVNLEGQIALVVIYHNAVVQNVSLPEVALPVVVVPGAVVDVYGKPFRLGLALHCAWLAVAEQRVEVKVTLELVLSGVGVTRVKAVWKLKKPEPNLF